MSVFLEAASIKLPLVIARHRHLKWAALDPVEHGLMVFCGISIFGFTFSVFTDVVTRTLGFPILWLQLATTGFFAWGIFIGMAVATRRIDHLNLVEITKRMSGPSAPLWRSLIGRSSCSSRWRWLSSAFKTL